MIQFFVQAKNLLSVINAVQNIAVVAIGKAGIKANALPQLGGHQLIPAQHGVHSAVLKGVIKKIQRILHTGEGAIHKAWGKEIGRRIVNAYLDAPNPSGSNRTLSCVNLSKVEKLKKAVDQYFALLGGKISEEEFPEVARGRGSAQCFGCGVTAEQDYDLVDILSLARELPNVNSDAFSRLKWALSGAVFCRACLRAITGWRCRASMCFGCC